jgi:hypothetical protein
MLLPPDKHHLRELSGRRVSGKAQTQRDDAIGLQRPRRAEVFALPSPVIAYARERASSGSRIAFHQSPSGDMGATLSNCRLNNAERRTRSAKREPYATRPWQFLYFFPLPQGQGSLRPTVTVFCRTLGITNSNSLSPF